MIKWIMLVLTLLIPYFLKCQIFADSQDFGTTGICVGCEVQNPTFCIDTDPATYSLINLTASTAGSSVFQNLYFPNTGDADSFVGFIIQADNLIEVTEEIIAGVMITTYNGAVANTPRSAADLSISAYGSGTQYILQYIEPNVFDRIQISLNPSVLPSALNAFRIYSGYYSNTSLPVKLLSFTAKHLNNAILLKWATSQEINNDYFTIERSDNGKNFETIGIIKGHGTKNDMTEYSYQDYSLKSGMVYYQLKQTDYDGTSEVLKMTSIHSKKENHIFPNPARNFVKVELIGKGDHSIILQDMSGTTHYENQITANEQKMKFAEINLVELHLARGLYYLTLTSDSEKLITKLQIE